LLIGRLELKLTVADALPLVFILFKFVQDAVPTPASLTTADGYKEPPVEAKTNGVEANKTPAIKAKDDPKYNIFFIIYIIYFL